MANILHVFMAPDDERAFLRELERHRLEVYPRRVPEGWTPFLASAANLERLPGDDLYLAASELGPVLVDVIKRGPDKGAWRVDEVRSPVIYLERSRRDEEDGALIAGTLWAELEITQQTGRMDPKDDKLRRLFLEIENWIKKTYRRSDPKGHFVGPAAAREFKQGGLKLRSSGHRGFEVRPYK